MVESRYELGDSRNANRLPVRLGLSGVCWASLALIASMHVYEVRPRKDHRGVDLISGVLPFGRLWYDTPDNAIGYAMHRSRSHGDSRL